MLSSQIDLLLPVEFYDACTYNPIKFNLAVDIIDKCNYNCYYCYNNKTRTYRQLNLDKLYKFSLFLLSKNPHLKINIQILGGEPTLHSQLDKFIDLCYGIPSIQCVLFSNLSADLDKYISYLYKNVQLNLSMHFIEKSNHSHAFIDKVQQLPQIFFDSGQVNVAVLYDSIKWQQSIDMFKKLFFLYPQNVSLPMLMDNQNFKCNYSNEMYKQYDDIVYFNQQYARCRKRYELLIKQGYHTEMIQREKLSDARHFEYRQFYHYFCDAGKYSLYVHNDGYVYACEAYYDLHKPLCTLDTFLNMKMHQTLCMCELCGCAENTKKLKVFTEK